MPEPSKVSLAYVHEDTISANFDLSYKALMIWDLTRSGHLAHENGEIKVRGVRYDLVTARNMIAKQFLDETDSEWLLSIDSDMGFQPDSLDRLLAVADATERPIVGGLCFAARETGEDGMGGYRHVARPTILMWGGEPGKRGFMGVDYYPVNRLMRCDATGSAFVLIHRSVFEKIREKFGEHWYTRQPSEDGGLMGEDVSFCLRAGACGIPVHVHTGIRTNHHKPQWVSEPAFWRDYPAPPATIETAVLVPVMKRPQNAKPFMESLRASTGLARVFAIADADDTETARAWHTAGAAIVNADNGPSFAQKVNVGFRHTTEPFIFLVGDDVRFRPGWLDHAQHVAETEGAHVVGTNDRANPRTMIGDHATHMLIRRSYVDDVGASFDGAGIVCHEGYRHWYVDDEIVTAAKQRGVWGMALGSIVEHHHPIFGLGEQDEVYELGQRAAADDAKLFKARIRRELAS